MPKWLLICALLLAPTACEDDGVLDEDDAEKFPETPLTDEQIREALLAEPSVTITTTGPGEKVRHADDPADFPLPIIEGALSVNIHYTERPGGVDVSQLTHVVKKPIDEVVRFYEDAMRDRGLNVQRNDTTVRGVRQIALLGSSGLVESTALISQAVKEDRPRVTISWEVRTSSAPATATSPG